MTQLRTTCILLGVITLTQSFSRPAQMVKKSAASEKVAAAPSGNSLIASGKVLKVTANQARQEISIQEESLGKQLWDTTYRYTDTFDARGDLVEERVDTLLGGAWIPVSKTQYAYDSFHQSTLEIDWVTEDGGTTWRIESGDRDQVDTLTATGQKIRLENATWDSQLKTWISADTMLWDSKGRIVLETNVNLGSDDLPDNYERSTYEYQSDDAWFETNQTREADETTWSTDKLRYHKIPGIGSMLVYSIDYYDATVRAWLTDVAREYKRVEKGIVILDSIAEIIDNRPVPTYVETMVLNAEGELKSSHVMRKEYDEDTKIWTGTNSITLRSFDKATGIYTSTDSTFSWDNDRANWKLNAYIHENYLEPAGTGWTETGTQDTIPGRFIRTLESDSMIMGGKILSWTSVWDPANARWNRGQQFVIQNHADTVSIVEQTLSGNPAAWTDDTLTVAILDANGQLKSELVSAWKIGKVVIGQPAKNRWNPLYRITYLREKIGTRIIPKQGLITPPKTHPSEWYAFSGQPHSLISGGLPRALQKVYSINGQGALLSLGKEKNLGWRVYYYQ